MQSTSQYCQDLTDFMIEKCIRTYEPLKLTSTNKRRCEINGLFVFDSCIKKEIDVCALNSLLKPNHSK